jgi:LytS/YehU family sensor histidine kinase
MAQERKLVEAYLAMEQMRLGERLGVHWNWPDWADAILVPPFFLQPLVENAIKHGISPSDQGGALAISCSRTGDAIALKVENSGCALADKPVMGVGLGNLEARLALWKPSSGTLTLERDGQGTVATVRWNTREDS